MVKSLGRRHSQVLFLKNVFGSLKTDHSHNPFDVWMNTKYKTKSLKTDKINEFSISLNYC